VRERIRRRSWLVVLSGGGSALMVEPAAGVTLADKVEITAALLASGADIAAINAVRKHCSRVKGGGLARSAARAAAALDACPLRRARGRSGDHRIGATVADPTTFAVPKRRSSAISRRARSRRRSASTWHAGARVASRRR